MKEARCGWLMPVILAIWEADIRRIAVHETPSQPIVGSHSTHLSPQAVQEAEIRMKMVPGQPRQNSSRDHHLNRKNLGMVTHACHNQL
jgi:hypothetical protein